MIVSPPGNICGPCIRAPPAGTIVSGLPPFSDTRWIPFVPVANTICPSCQLAPNGGKDLHNTIGAPPVTATFLNGPSPPPASKYAIHRPSGENTGLSTPTAPPLSTLPPTTCRV